MSIFHKKKKEKHNTDGQMQQRHSIMPGSNEYIRFLVCNLRSKISMLRKPEYAAEFDWLKQDEYLCSFTDITPYEHIMDVDDFNFFATLINEHMEMYTDMYGKKELKLVNKSPNPDPSYSNITDSGMDIRAWITENDEGAMFDGNEWFIEIQPGETRMIHTGIYLEMPKDCEVQVRPRSGLAAKHGISVTNTPGTCDPSYRGEICVLLLNTKNNMTDDFFQVKNGDRIAQLVLSRVLNGERVSVKKIDEVSKNTDRGAEGFGHTGVK